MRGVPQSAWANACRSDYQCLSPRKAHLQNIVPRQGYWMEWTPDAAFPDTASEELPVALGYALIELNQARHAHVLFTHYPWPASPPRYFEWRFRRRICRGFNAFAVWPDWKWNQIRYKSADNPAYQFCWRIWANNLLTSRRYQKNVKPCRRHLAGGGCGMPC